MHTQHVAVGVVVTLGLHPLAESLADVPKAGIENREGGRGVVGERLELAQQHRHLFQKPVQVAFVSAQSLLQTAERGVRVGQLIAELLIVGRHRIEDAGAVRQIVSKRLVLTGHHGRDPIEFDVERVQLLVAVGDAPGDRGGILRDARQCGEQCVQIGATVLEAGAAFAG